MAEYAQFQRLLVDAKAEARTKACAEITAKTAATFTDVPPEEAYRITIKSLQTIDQSFVKNAAPAFRRGGMASVRATISGIPQGAHKKHNPEFIKVCADLVLPCFADVDPTVRIAALEAAHEMVRKFQSQLFATSFMELFRSLLAVMSDRDRRCLQLGRELSNTVREFVTGSESAAFSPESFVSFFTEAMDPLLNPASAEIDASVVQWLLEWISHVYDLPNHELVLQLPRFLNHLFHLIARCPSPEASKIMERSLQDAKRAYQQGLQINILELMTTSVNCVNVIENPPTRILALMWISELLRLGHAQMLPLTHLILDCVLPQLSAKEGTIRVAAQSANGLLQQLLVQNESQRLAASSITFTPVTPQTTGAQPSEQSMQQSAPVLVVQIDGAADGAAVPAAGAVPVSVVAYHPVLQTIKLHLEVKAKEDTRVASLEWFLLIHGVRPDVIHAHFETVFEAILTTLSDLSESVMHKSMEVLHILAGEDRFSYFIQQLLHHFEMRAPVLLAKAPTIIKQLQLRYQGDQSHGFQTSEKLLLKIAELLPQRRDMRLVEKLVIVLNMMLLTSKEFMPLREVLRRGVGDARARAAFLVLYKCWCYDTTAAVALCLLTTAYSQAYRLVVLLGSAELSPQTLIQVDRLVQLLESPVFSFLRIALLQPTKNAALVKSLFGLQMILPQTSPQYKALSARLKSVPSVAQLDLAAESHGFGTSLDVDPEDATRIAGAKEAISIPEWRALERHCVDAQAQVVAYESTLRLQR